jgi:hypothetical protein
MARARIVFRVLMFLTLAVPSFVRIRGGFLPRAMREPFTSWFLISVAVFGAFGLLSAYYAFRDQENRRAWLTDVVLAAAWVPYWMANLDRVPSLFR